MNIYITLDYELFFGAESGSVDQCIIKPTQALLDLVEPYDIKFTCFVDSGYLLALKKNAGSFPELRNDYEKIAGQIKMLSDLGHGIELHIHPHWEDSFYDGKKWVFNTSRYKLSNFSEHEAYDIIKKYNQILINLSGKNPKAYRAGGWSAQPFSQIKRGLEDENIFIDSSVYPKGVYNSENQKFDFSRVPMYKTKYHFSDDLTIEQEDGAFTEIPISSIKVNPLFFWKFLLTKIFKTPNHKPFGNGKPITMKRTNIFRLLTTFSNSVVSMDGFKASLLQKAFKKYEFHASNYDNFVIIGHPKAFTSFSLKKFGAFIQNTHTNNRYKIFQ